MATTHRCCVHAEADGTIKYTLLSQTLGCVHLQLIQMFLMCYIGEVCGDHKILGRRWLHGPQNWIDYRLYLELMGNTDCIPGYFGDSCGVQPTAVRPYNCLPCS